MNYILSVVCLGVRGILNLVHVDLVGSVRVSVRVNVRDSVRVMLETYAGK